GFSRHATAGRQLQDLDHRDRQHRTDARDPDRDPGRGRFRRSDAVAADAVDRRAGLHARQAPARGAAIGARRATLVTLRSSLKRAWESQNRANPGRMLLRADLRPAQAVEKLRAIFTQLFDALSQILSRGA